MPPDIDSFLGPLSPNRLGGGGTIESSERPLGIDDLAFITITPEAVGQVRSVSDVSYPLSLTHSLILSLSLLVLSLSLTHSLSHSLTLSLSLSLSLSCLSCVVLCVQSQATENVRRWDNKYTMRR